MSSDPLGDWEAQWDPPLTAVHERYVDVFLEWLRSGDEARPKHEQRRRNLLALMQYDGHHKENA